MTPDGLVTEVDGNLRLVGSRCRSCGAVTFPGQGSCPRCTGVDVERHALAASGTLWSWTIQGFPPKTPYLRANEPFEPFGVGYVDLDGEVFVEARLVADDLADLRIGQTMELVLEPLGDRSTYAFRPTGGAA